MKISKELKTGIITVVAIAFLVMGVNFLKGNSFFGGDKTYYTYVPNSGQITAGGNVTLNGVIVGKILSVDYIGGTKPDRSVKVSFNILKGEVQIPKGSKAKLGSIDLFNKGIILEFNPDLSKGAYKPGSVIPGYVEVDILSQVKEYADPIVQKVQGALSTVDKVVNSFSAFWDTTATSELAGTLRELKFTIHKLGGIADQVDNLVGTEKVKFSNILSNVESISLNIKKSNDKINAILGNAEKFSGDLASADFKKTISNANAALEHFNALLNDANNGNGTLGKLLKDEKLYNELNLTNQKMQSLVNDIEVHPERYIHFSVLGAKTKGVPLTTDEEKKLHQLLDTISIK